MLDVSCDYCGKPLTEPGALMFSPPDPRTRQCMKLHVCVLCWRSVERQRAEKAGGANDSTDSGMTGEIGSGSEMYASDPARGGVPPSRGDIGGPSGMVGSGAAEASGGESCATCKGSGGVHAKSCDGYCEGFCPQPCPACNGTGRKKGGA